MSELGGLRPNRRAVAVFLLSGVLIARRHVPVNATRWNCSGHTDIFRRGYASSSVHYIVQIRVQTGMNTVSVAMAVRVNNVGHDSIPKLVLLEVRRQSGLIVAIDCTSDVDGSHRLR